MLDTSIFALMREHMGVPVKEWMENINIKTGIQLFQPSTGFQNNFLIVTIMSVSFPHEHLAMSRIQIKDG